MASLKKFLKESGFVSVKMKRTPTGHLEISATLNGVKGRFILDTGASNTCVSLDRAEKFGLVSEASEVKAAGAGAVDMEARVSGHNSLQLGRWKKSRLQVVLFDMSHVNHALTSQESGEVDGIIGADILKKGKAVIDYRKYRLYLK
ncbi:retropepsin-like aspartic protease [Robiginitalea marina]|uniref:Retroviral-like aspartic protease family protein n=1 Tax=Robiginitalea marina TaxID=2954105 RepID=A0ABT1AZ92_9FLAO|nr:retropepsin-like aspartic protease [Robiginitalea marina]MCO5724917.1 retroviral-like aspartic protease family protein [Robiginitalea marina]